MISNIPREKYVELRRANGKDHADSFQSGWVEGQEALLKYLEEECIALAYGKQKNGIARNDIDHRELLARIKMMMEKQ